MRGRALLFGLNYPGSSAQLNGCVNDVVNMSNYLAVALNVPITVCTDDSPNTRSQTTAMGIVQNLYELAVQSYKEDLEFAWIHYSGHGSYMADTSNDEKDGRDECLVPNDYATAGLITDDCLNRVFGAFNPKTRVVFVCDACHSGTVCDVKYSWESPTKCMVENITCSVRAKVLTLSGCLDDQTSADAFNVMGDSKFSGALTACLLKVLQEAPQARTDVFQVFALLSTKLKVLGFTQRPKLCSTYNLARERVFF
jgi:hypothetical protein